MINVYMAIILCLINSNSSWPIKNRIAYRRILRDGEIFAMKCKSDDEFSFRRMLFGKFIFAHFADAESLSFGVKKWIIYTCHLCVWDNIYPLDHESGIHVIIHVYAVRRLLWQPNEYFGMICHYCSCGFIFSLKSFSFNFHSRYQKPKEIHSTKVIVIW